MVITGRGPCHTDSKDHRGRDGGDDQTFCEQVLDFHGGPFDISDPLRCRGARALSSTNLTKTRQLLRNFEIFPEGL
jgi:hypothetical protein